MQNQNFSLKSPLLGVRVCTLNRVTGASVQTTTGSIGVLVKRLIVTAWNLAGHMGSTRKLVGHIGSTGKLVRHLGSMVATRNIGSIGSIRPMAAFPASRKPSSMLTLLPPYKSTSVSSYHSISSSVRPTTMALKSRSFSNSLSNASSSNATFATFSMANSHVRVGSLSPLSHVNVQSLRHFCTSSDEEEIFLYEEASLIEELCTKIVSLYHNSQKLSLFPSLRPFDIEEIRRLVLCNDYRFSSLEILSFPKDEYITYPFLDPDYPDVHIRYNDPENLVYVIKPTSPRDCLVFLALANTLYSYFHDFCYDDRYEDRSDIYKCLKDLEPVDLLYKIDLTPSYSRLKKDALFRSLKSKLRLDIPYENPFLEEDIPDERLFSLLKREKRVMASKQIFSMLESISSLPITKGDPFQGPIPRVLGLPPVGGELSAVLLDVLLLDRFDKEFEKAFPNFFRNQQGVFIPIQLNGKINPSIDRNELDKFIQKIGLRGTISSISRSKGVFPFSYGFYDDDDDCSDNILVITPTGKFKLVDSRDYFDFDFDF